MTTLTTLQGNRIKIESPNPLKTFNELYPNLKLNIMKANEEKLTFIGSMNYVVQAWRENGVITIDQYQPRKNRIWSGEIPEDKAKENIQETIERMKIAITLFEEFLEGKRDSVYYWQEDDEDKKRQLPRNP